MTTKKAGRSTPAKKIGQSTKVKRAQIVSHLSESDKKLAKLIEQVGEFALEVNALQSSYEALAESIIYQQITGKAAKSIHNKVVAHFNDGDIEAKFPHPKEILKADEVRLRSCGLSRGKVLAIKDLAEKTLEGVVPDVDEMHELEDEELIERLTSIRGIGPWTVQMLLIFRLGREDILPNTDYGIRKGFALTYWPKSKQKGEALPTPSEIAKQAERWRPYRTCASWYLWRALDLD